MELLLVKVMKTNMETITISQEGLKKLVNRTSGMTSEYKREVIEALFEAQRAITEGDVNSLMKN